jgi:phosphate uptake regulator
VAPTDAPEHLFRSLLGAYLGGAVEFVVLLPDRDRSAATRQVVTTFCRRTLRPEIVSDSDGFVRLRETAGDLPQEIPARLGRMGARVLEFQRDAVASWSGRPSALEVDWDRLDDDIDRDAWQIQRWVVRQFGSPTAATAVPGPWTAARSLERIADHAVQLGELGGRFADLPEASAATTQLRRLHGQAMDHLAAVLRANGAGAANDLLDVGEALLLAGRSVADDLLSGRGPMVRSPAASVALSRALESIGRTIAYTQDIAQVLLDRPMAWEADPAELQPPVGPPRSFLATPW